MIADVIENSTKFEIFVDGKNVEVEDIKQNFLELVDSAYIVPARAIMGDINFDVVKQTGVWIDIYFDKIINYGECTFDKLTLQLKPKYDFLVFYPNNADKYTRPISVNLAMKTTKIYNKIKGLK